MNLSTKKWLFTKISSAILIPLMIWFLLKFVSLFDSDYQTLIDLVTVKSFKLVFTGFILTAFLFYTLTISEIFEDYINDQKIKNVANKVVFTFAIIILIFTLIILHTL